MTGTSMLKQISFKTETKPEKSQKLEGNQIIFVKHRQAPIDKTQPRHLKESDKKEAHEIKTNKN